jgi:sugar lactone lactonase YvrE
MKRRTGGLLVNRRQALTGFAAAAVVTAVGVPTRADAAPTIFPDKIDLPNGWQPEGIAIGVFPYAFFGSRATGSIYRASLVTGRGKIITTNPGGPSLGMKVDLRGRLFVAGGNRGNGRVVHAFTGDVLATYAFATGTSFVNDVIVTPHGAYFTDSVNPFLYVVPFGLGGRLPDPSAVVRLPITGDLVYQAGFNVNGISRTPDGAALLVVQSNTGGLFRVDPATGASRRVDLGGQTVLNGDGILLVGHTLYVVQNQDELVAVIALNDAGTSGTVLRRTPDSRFDIPTTAAWYKGRLWVVNARFSTAPTPDTEYTAVALTP